MLQLLFLVLFLYCIILHEIAHGYAAYLLGDDTAYRAGRLSLNPLVHIDPVGSILIPALLLFSHAPFVFGFARPVPINPFKFHKISNLRAGIAICSAAGPGANLVLGFVFCQMAKMSFNPYAAQLFLYAAGLNVILAVFNLLPIPGFDGAHILAALLPREWFIRYKALEPYGMIIALVLLATGVIGWVLFPLVEVILRWMC